MKFFLCDDGKKVLDFYRTKIEFLCNKHNIDFDCTLYTSGLMMLDEFQEQDAFEGVIFLDINMPDIDGMTLARKLREKGCLGEIIFLTISKEHILDAFDVHAFHYVIKSETTDQRFEEIFLRAVRSSVEKAQDYIVFSSNGEHRNIAIQKIYYFEVLQRIITVHYDDDRFEFFSTMGKLENQLFSKGFVRIHRSYMVSVHQIQRFTYTEVMLRNGTTLPVGRKYYQEIKKAVTKFSNSDNNCFLLEE
jgi:DNA-binding LytR/AlgR family response regulator